jgi:hypothetical protein
MTTDTGLRVTRSFSGYALGETITDPATIKSIIDSEQSAFVVRVSLPAAAAASPAKEG